MRHLEELRRLRGIDAGVEGSPFGRPLDREAGAAEDEQVEVELARTPTAARRPAESTLELLERGQQLGGPGRRVNIRRDVDRRDRVVEVGLVRHSDRGGRVETRHAGEADARQVREGHDGARQGRWRVADVPAEADVGADPAIGHGSSCSSGFDG